MEYFNKVQKNFTKLSSYLNGFLFDKDFLLVLRVFYFLGFHRHKSSMYGFLVFSFVPMSYYIGELKDAIKSFQEGNTHRFLISTAYSSFLTSTTIQIITFIIKERQIIQVIKAFQNMHRNEDENKMRKYKVICYQLAKYYTIYLTSAMTVVVILTLSRYNIFKLASPTLFDAYAEGNLFVPLLTVNIIQIYIVAVTTSSSDLLHVLLMIRAGANFKLLSDKLRHCTDSEDAEKNEMDLIACIKYHRCITKEIKKVKEIFVFYFMSKVFGSLVIMISGLFVMMKKSEEASTKSSFIFGLLSMSIALFQIGSLCLIGEWMTTTSDDLLNASYECKWFKQSKSFKKTLMIFRVASFEETRMGIIKFDFSNQSFYNILSSSFYYYSNMSRTITSIGRQV